METKVKQGYFNLKTVIPHKLENGKGGKNREP
jgi:hypothetical protein